MSKTTNMSIDSNAIYETSVDETASVMLGSGDVADDPEIWIHPTRPNLSVVLGVNKSSDGINGGLYAYELDGSPFGSNTGWSEGVNLFEKGERYNNLDLRYGFPAGAETWDIVCVSNRSDREIDVFRVLTNSNGDFAGMEHVGEIPLGNGFASGSSAPYGLAMYHSKSQGIYYVLASDKKGKVSQYRLDFDPNGSGESQIVGTRVAGLRDVSRNNSEVEGIVADDERDVIYIAAEDKGIYRYATDSSGVMTGKRTTVATASGNDALVPDLEGMTMYYGNDGTGYIISSVQGNSTYAVFDREFEGSQPNKFLKTFSIKNVEKTDSLAVTNVNLGGLYDSGMLVVHDGVGGSPTRYKFISWEKVANDGSVPLNIDTSFDPRAESSMPFDDSEILNLESDLTSYSTKSNNQLEGSNKDDEFTLTGDRSIANGYAGSDTYNVYTDGNHLINDKAGNSEISTDIVNLYGVNPEQVTVSQSSSSPNDIVLSFGADSSLTLKSQLSADGLRQIEEIRFNDDPSIIWNASYLESMF